MQKMTQTSAIFGDRRLPNIAGVGVFLDLPKTLENL
jgi:hypothetical protein